MTTHLKANKPCGENRRAEVTDREILLWDLVLGRRWSMRPFHDDVYAPFVEFMFHSHDLQADHGSVVAGKRWLKSEESHEVFRYCFLKANEGSGEGDLVVQPWIVDQGDLWLEDVTCDWIADIGRLREGEDDDPEPQCAEYVLSETQATGGR